MYLYLYDMDSFYWDGKYIEKPIAKIGWGHGDYEIREV